MLSTRLTNFHFVPCKRELKHELNPQEYIYTQHKSAKILSKWYSICNKRDTWNLHLQFFSALAFLFISRDGNYTREKYILLSWGEPACKIISLVSLRVGRTVNAPVFDPQLVPLLSIAWTRVWVRPSSCTKIGRINYVIIQKRPKILYIHFGDPKWRPISQPVKL